MINSRELEGENYEFTDVHTHHVPVYRELLIYLLSPFGFEKNSSQFTDEVLASQTFYDNLVGRSIECDCLVYQEKLLQ
jgi:hypothetical protein